MAMLSFVTSRRVGGRIPTGQNFFHHLMAMLRFIRHVLKSPVSRPPTSRRHVTSGRIPTGQNFFPPSPDGNAQILPTCPKVARQPAPSPHFQPSRHVGSDSDGTKFVSHLMAMLRFIRRVLKSPVSRPPHFPPSRHVTSDSDGTKFVTHLMAMLIFIRRVLKSPVSRPPHFQPSRHVGSDSDGPKFVSHLMAMLRFIRHVLKSPVSRPPTSRRHVTSGRIPTGQNFPPPPHLMAMLRFFRRVLKSPVSRPHPPISSRHVTSGRIPTGQNLSVTLWQCSDSSDVS